MLGAQSGQEKRTWTLDEKGIGGERCQKGSRKSGHSQESILPTLLLSPHSCDSSSERPSAPVARRGV